MNAIVLQGIGETLEGLSIIIQSQVLTVGLTEKEKLPLLQAHDLIVKARMQLSVALATYIDNELNQ